MSSSSSYEVHPTPVNRQDPKWTDKFSVEMDGHMVHVKRIDKDAGWGQNLQFVAKKNGMPDVKIYVGPSSTSVKSVLPSVALGEGTLQGGILILGSGTLVITVGCFDRFHAGHERLLTTMKASGADMVVAGVHSSESIQQIKGIVDVQSLATRKKNVLTVADDVFEIHNSDPTESIRMLAEKHPHKQMCFVRANDNRNFPGMEYVQSRMPIYFLPYTQRISSTALRTTSTKVGVMNRLLRCVKTMLDANHLPYYLDCGTLLGCVRNRSFIEYDTDVDVTLHLSSWEAVLAIDVEEYGLVRTRVYRNFQKKDAGNMLSVSLKGHNSHLYCDIYANPAFPLRQTAILNGIEYPVPENPGLYLSQLYGENWEVPTPGRHAGTRFHRNGGLVRSAYRDHWDPAFPVIDCKR